MQDDEDLFAKAMSQVRPLRPTEKRIGTARSKKASRKRPVQPLHAPVAPAVAAGPDQPHDQPWTLVASGVSRERLRRLASGRLPIEVSFDLHGMSRNEALACLERGIGEMLQTGRRVACIIHGRGLHSEHRPILKEATYRWLAEGPLSGHVLAAIPQPGSGGGACLVLLRRR